MSLESEACRITSMYGLHHNHMTDRDKWQRLLLLPRYPYILSIELINDRKN